MTKVDEGFRALRSARAPELWRDIEQRTPRPLAGPSLPRRLGIAALALTIAGTGTWLAARAFVRPEPGARAAEEPVGPPTLRLGPAATFRGAGGGGPLYAFGSVWIPQHHVVGKADVLLRVDPETLDVEAQIEIPSAPGWEIGNSGLAASEDAVWIVGGTGAGGTLAKIDPATNEVSGGVPLGGEFAGDVEVSGRQLWVSLFEGNGEVSVVQVHDTDVPDVLASVELQGGWVREVFAVEGRIVVHTRGGEDVNGLTVIDPATGKVVASNGFKEAIFTEWDGSIWAGATDEILRIDASTAEIVETTPAGSYITQSSIAGGAGAIWFVGHDAEGNADAATRLMRFNPESGRVDASIDVGGDPVALEVGGGAVWVLGYDGTLTRVDIVPS